MPLDEPRLWYTLRRYFALSSALTTCWWQALQQTQAPRSKGWFERLLFYDQRPSWNHEPEAIERYILRSLPPREIMAVLESLVEEGLLTRPEGTALEEHVLAQVDKAGQWITERSGVPPPDV